MNITKEYALEVGGKTLTASFSDLTDQTNGSVIVSYGKTTVLVTAVMSKHDQKGQNWFPLSVEYEEKFYAAGKILGSRFMRREGRPTDEAILSGRAIDRTIRPLFDHDMRRSVQVVVSVLSIGEDDPDVLAINAASLALATSDIPWAGPVSAVRVQKNTEESDWTINPTYEVRADEGREIDLLACGKDGAINMIEVEGQEAPEDNVAAGFSFASEEIEKIQAWQEGIIKEIGKEKQEVAIERASEAVKELYEKEIATKLEEAVFSGPGKKGISDLKHTFQELMDEHLPDENHHLGHEYVEAQVDVLLHAKALNEDKRVDGRAMDEVRTISAQAGGVSPMAHGLGVFYRGGTHILSALTLGGPGDAQIVDGMEVQMNKRYMHHYNFPPFSVGETGRVGGFNRRATGHGTLGEKALLPVLPSQEEFPYTIRIVSEVFASNGSSSMGGACGSSLALMDAGVPIKAPVAGIAMGLVLDEANHDNYKILTDIQGPEDHHGDMDFKVAGTRTGVTAIQMDVKVGGVPVKILTEALAGARAAREHILDVMEAEIAAPRESLREHAPHIEVLQIKPDQIGLVIGSGGKTVNKIKEDTETEIDIEDEGLVYITGTGEGPAKARQIIADMTKEWQPGERAEGEVTRILDFGAFVKIGYEAEGLVHISELAPFRINKVTDVVKEGETVPVVVKEIDDQGRINLSIKQADPEFAAKKGIKPAAAPAPSRAPHGGQHKPKPRREH